MTRIFCRISFALGLWGLIGCGGGGDAGPGVKVTVMTRNLFLGSDLTEAALASSKDAIPGNAAKLWRTIVKSDFAARAELLADEIGAAKPDLVALQEVELYRSQTPGDFSWAMYTANADKVEQDFLEILMNALTKRGERYQVVIAAPYTDAELPVAEDAELPARDLRLLDRDVILAREGIKFSKAAQKTFKTYIPLPLGGIGGVIVPMRRGLSVVQVQMEGVTFTFGNTHLEVGGGPARTFQEGQALDFLDLVAAIDGPLLVAGDFNSSPNTMDANNTKTYKLVAEKLTEAWPQVNPGLAGFTCCGELKEETFTPKERIDLLFHKGAVKPTSAQVVGLDPAKRTAAGLWPSDHAGVVFTVMVGGK